MKKILIIDDEVELAEMVKMRLQHKGYEVKTLSSPVKSLEVIKKEMPNVILLDIMMPEKDGYQVCDEIKSDDEVKNIPIIVFTANPPEQETIERLHSFYGAQDYIVKPINHEELLEKIQKHLK